MDPPAESQYPTRNALVEAVQNHAKMNGYAITVKRSCSRDNTVILGCDRGGQYRARNGITNETRRRNTSTRLCGCPFSLQGKMKNDIWYLTVKNPSHNHEPSTITTTHPIQRRMPIEVKNPVKQLTAAGVASRQVALVVRQATNHPLIAQDVYNVQKQVRLENLAGKTPMESLVHVVKNSQYHYNYVTDAEGHVSHFFFAHPQSVELLNRYPDILLLDCTYKTNRFKMPLLSIVGATCTHQTYHVSFTFLKNETEESYIWALYQLQNLFQNNYTPRVLVTDRDLALLNAIAVVFPTSFRHICIWHVEKNVLIQATTTISDTVQREQFMQQWTKILASDSVATYEDRLRDLRHQFSEYPLLLKYLDDTWLLPWKQSIVRAWTDCQLHFGHRATSRVEGSHKSVKTYLQVSTGDLKSVFDKITLLLENKFHEHDALLDSNRSRIPHANMNQLYEQLLGRISHYALGLLHSQRQRLVLETPLKACTGLFRKSIGLPCAHEMQQRISIHGSLVLEDCHQHWHLVFALLRVPEPLVLAPRYSIPKGRPTTNRNPISSTSRDASAFEMVSLSQKKKDQQRKRQERLSKQQQQRKQQQREQQQQEQQRKGQQQQYEGQQQLEREQQEEQQQQQEEQREKQQQRWEGLQEGHQQQREGRWERQQQRQEEQGQRQQQQQEERWERQQQQHKGQQQRQEEQEQEQQQQQRQQYGWQRQQQGQRGQQQQQEQQRGGQQQQHNQRRQKQQSDESDLSEDELMEIELQRLVKSGGQASPLWATMPEFAGMTRATRSFARLQQRKK